MEKKEEQPWFPPPGRKKEEVGDVQERGKVVQGGGVGVTLSVNASSKGGGKGKTKAGKMGGR